MSELKSLYVRIKIKKENLERFFQDKPVAATIDPGWTDWWNSRNMYSPSPLTELPYYSTMETNRAVVDAFLNDRQSWTVEQNEGQGEWVFSIIFFSENYTEILPMLAWLKSIANYQDAGDEGIAMVYDFFWGGKLIMAHIVLDNQQASLKTTKHISEVEPAIMTEVTTGLQKAWKVIDAQYANRD
jgi:hypothetical protein